MIKVKETITISIKIEFILLIDWITIHLGRNPKNGGRPPNDNKEINILYFINGLSLKNENIWFKWKNLNKLKINTNVKER